MGSTAADQLGPLAALIGTWSGRGEGDYPTISPFRYHEQVVFTHAGRPFLAYGQRTRHPDSGHPMHAESGYLRLAGPGRVEWTIAQPTGLAETLAGTVADGVLDLRDDAVGVAPTAKHVRAVRRRLVIGDDTLAYDLWMAFDHVPETHHLHAELHREERP